MKNPLVNGLGEGSSGLIETQVICFVVRNLDLGWFGWYAKSALKFSALPLPLIFVDVYRVPTLNFGVLGCTSLNLN